ncbi:hypothetical protein LNK15_03035 [Jeotgalicoccus huakuii]|nr:hypothetical protein [Jeotgalicoccus huakuii]
MNYGDDINAGLEAKGNVYVYVNGQSLKVQTFLDENDETLVVKTASNTYSINKSRIDYLKVAKPRSGDMPTLG